MSAPLFIPFPLKSGRFVYINAISIVKIFPAGEDYSDIYMDGGLVVSVEGNEHKCYAMIEAAYLSESEDWEEDGGEEGE